MTYIDNSQVRHGGSSTIKTENVIAIIPAYNEVNNIVNIINQVKNHVSSIIVIDDGSVDDTYKLALSTNIKVVRNNRNRGKGAALKRGFLESLKHNPDIVITIDADGQHDPEDIPILLKPIQEGMADLVIGSRYNALSIKKLLEYAV